LEQFKIKDLNLNINPIGGKDFLLYKNNKFVCRFPYLCCVLQVMKNNIISDLEGLKKGISSND